MRQARAINERLQGETSAKKERRCFKLDLCEALLGVAELLQLDSEAVH